MIAAIGCVALSRSNYSCYTTTGERRAAVIPSGRRLATGDLRALGTTNAGRAYTRPVLQDPARFPLDRRPT
jgi:hypothetical protein